MLEKLKENVSIHTPAWGVTRKLDSLQPGNLSFNPHARVGRDSDLIST